MTPQWNKKHAVEWDQKWNEPIMQKGMELLKAEAKVSGKPEALPPGYDGIALSAMENQFKKGQQSILDKIEDLSRYHEIKDIGKPFTPNKPPQTTETQ